MLYDIESRADIDALMVLFYSRAMSDPAIGHFFGEVTNFDLERHLPVIGDFWESVLFGRNVYGRHGRNPLMIHAAIDAKAPLHEGHFSRWLALFTAAVDELFSGARADYAKQRSNAIARRMREYVENGE